MKKTTAPKKATKKVRKPSTPEQRAKARERHWRRTGVSSSTIEWMKNNSLL